jgi:ATP-binding cassette, subfamily F, member 3
LDIDTVEALIQALQLYEGGILFVSHDQHLIESVCAEIWVCDDHKIELFDGTFSEYKKSLEKKAKY